MGAKRPSVRTLKTGEKVVHYPSGEQLLVAHNSLLDTLVSTEEADRAADAALTDQRLAAVDAKRESLDAGDAVPDDKRVV